jgi:type I restriction enzyme S subunit
MKRPEGAECEWALGVAGEGCGMKYKLADIFDLQMGKTPSRNNADYWNTTDNKWISIGDLSQTGKYIYETKEYLSDNAVAESGIKIIPKNTVVMSFKLSIGKTAITPEDMYSNEAVMAFHDKHVIEMLPEYIYYMFKYRDWDSGTNKAVMGKTLNKATISKIEVEICDINRQREIVEVLDKVSNVIDERIDELLQLDTLIRARFVEMFGDTFANPMQWERQTFKEAGIRLSDGPFGSNLKSEHYSNTGVRVIRLGNIGVGRFIDNDKSYISNEHYERLKKYTCIAGEIVIGTLGEPNLRACIVPDEVGIAINKADCVHYIPKPDILNTQFVCQYINCPETLKLAAGMIHGQTRARISSGQIAEMPLFIPPMELQQQFADFVAQVDKSKVAVQKSLEQTQLLFDSLMQKYFG